MKAVPLKRCDGSGASLGNALSVYISANYNSTDVKELVEQVGALRQRVITICASNPGEHSPDDMLEAMTQYYSMLLPLQKRFPFGKHRASLFSSSTPCVRALFQWNDAFRPSKSSTSFDIESELRAIMFNIGAAYSQQASAADRHSAEGIKLCAQGYLRASGVFEQMCDVSAPVEETGTPDTEGTTAQWLSQVCFAQACAATFENAIFKKLRSKTIAGVAKGAADEFRKADELLTQSTSLLRYIEKSKLGWNKHCKYQSLCFQSASQYWMAKEDIANEKYGTEIARLQSSLSTLQEAMKYEHSSNSAVTARVQLCNAIETRLAAAMHDNDTIYYDAVVRRRDLDVVLGKVIGAPIPLAVEDWPLPDSMALLVPRDVKELVLKLSSNCMSLLSELRKSSDEQLEFSRGILSSMSLPGALEAQGIERGIPNTLWGRIVYCQSQGANTLSKLRQELRTASVGCAELIDKACSLLESEVSDEKRMREIYGFQWERPPSEVVNTEYHHHVGEARKAMNHAHITDEKVLTNLDNQSSALKSISRTREDIEMTMPVSSTIRSTPESEAVKSSLDKLSEHLLKREQLLTSFKQSLDTRNFTDVLMNAPKFSLVATFELEFESFSKLAREIEHNIEFQSDLLEDVSSCNDLWKQMKTTDPSVLLRERILHDLNTAVDSFTKLHSQLIAGHNFYLDMMANHLNPLLQVGCSSFSISLTLGIDY